jgi:hypothetical protein
MTTAAIANRSQAKRNTGNASDSGLESAVYVPTSAIPEKSSR